MNVLLYGMPVRDGAFYILTSAGFDFLGFDFHTCVTFTELTPS